MFANERSVVINILGTSLSLFVDKDSVEGDIKEGKGLLRVVLLNEKDGTVSLPAETMEQGRRNLKIPLELLQYR
jgi:hypothetical protein